MTKVVDLETLKAMVDIPLVKIPSIGGQFAYLLFFAAFFSWNAKAARYLAIGGSAIGVLYTLNAENEPLWVPLVWHSAFLLINLAHVLYLSWTTRNTHLDPLETFLQKSVFTQFTNRELREFAKVGSEGSIPAGQVLIQAGSPVQEVCCILSGTASAVKNGIKEYDIKAGRLVAERAFLEEALSPSDIVANTDLVIMVWTRESIEAWVDRKNPRLRLLQMAIGSQLVAQILAQKSGKKTSGDNQGGSKLIERPSGTKTIETQRNAV